VDVGEYEGSIVEEAVGGTVGLLASVEGEAVGGGTYIIPQSPPSKPHSEVLYGPPLQYAFPIQYGLVTLHLG